MADPELSRGNWSRAPHYSHARRGHATDSAHERGLDTEGAQGEEGRVQIFLDPLHPIWEGLAPLLPSWKGLTPLLRPWGRFSSVATSLGKI